MAPPDWCALVKCRAGKRHRCVDVPAALGCVLLRYVCALFFAAAFVVALQ